MKRKAAVAFATSLAIVGCLLLLFLLERGSKGVPQGTPSTASKADGKTPRNGRRPAASGNDLAVDVGGVGKGAETEGQTLLSGRVLDADDRPIAKAHVTVRLPARLHQDLVAAVKARLEETEKGPKTVGKSAVTGKDGRYVVKFDSPPEPGEYRVDARAPGYATVEETWWNSGAPATLDFHLRHGGEPIDGVVVDSAGSPVARARVDAEREDEHKRRAPKVTKTNSVDHDVCDEQGRFHLAVGPGTYQLSAHAKGFGLATLSGVEAGTRDVRIRLLPPRGLTGVVSDETGAPLPGVEVAVYHLEQGTKGKTEKAHGFLHQPVKAVQTGADGAFALSEISLRGYLLEARKGGFEEERRTGTFPAEGDPPRMEIKLRPGGVLFGTVTDEAGAPVSDVMVAVRKDTQRWHGGRLVTGKKNETAPGAAEPFPSDAADYWPVKTDSQGAYRLDTLPRAATFTVMAQSEGHPPFVKANVEVRDRTELPIVLASGVTLSGKVLAEADASPVSRATLWVRLGEDDRRTAQTDAEGSYSFPGLLPGKLREVRIGAPGYSILYLEELEVAASPARQTRDFVLPRAASMAGKVVGPSGEPVAEALVRVASVESGDHGRRRDTEKSVRTDAGGAFAIEGISAGPAFRATVTHPGYQDFRSDPFPIAAGARLEGLLYRLKTGGKLTVTVLLPDESPAKEARVDLVREAEAAAAAKPAVEGGESRFTHSVSSDGKATFEGLAPGGYDVTVRAAGYQVFREQGVAVAEAPPSELTAKLVPENAITGTVTDAGGNPVQGARIRASLSPAAEERVRKRDWRGTEPEARATAGSDGSFRLPGLGEGPYVVHVTAEGFVSATVPRAPVNQPLEVKLQRRGSIVGSVAVAETGEAVQRFTVLLVKEKGAAGAPPAATEGAAGKGPEPLNFEDTGGAFRIPDVDPGRYRVQVAAAELGLGPREAEATVIEGGTARLPPFLLYEGLVVAGVVTDVKTDRPVAGAEVKVSYAPASQSSTKDERPGVPRLTPGTPPSQGEDEPQRVRPAAPPTVTDEGGSFAFKDLAPGSYLVAVNHPEFQIVLKAFEVPAQGVAPDLRIPLDSGETLSGTATGPDGSFLGGAVVTAQERDTPFMPLKKTVCDALGKYSLRGLRPAAYIVSLHLEGQVAKATVQVKKGSQNRYDFRRVALEVPH